MKLNRAERFLSSSFSNATLPLIQCPTLRQSQCLFPQTFGRLASSLRLVHCVTAVHSREALTMLINAVPERAQLSVHALHPQVGAENMSLASMLRALHSLRRCQCSVHHLVLRRRSCFVDILLALGGRCYSPIEDALVEERPGEWKRALRLLAPVTWNACKDATP